MVFSKIFQIVRASYMVLHIIWEPFGFVSFLYSFYFVLFCFAYVNFSFLSRSLFVNYNNARHWHCCCRLSHSARTVPFYSFIQSFWLLGALSLLLFLHLSLHLHTFFAIGTHVIYLFMDGVWAMPNHAACNEVDNRANTERKK